MSEKTTIEISTETWRELNLRKRGPSDTFEDVVRRLLEEGADRGRDGEEDAERAEGGEGSEDGEGAESAA